MIIINGIEYNKGQTGYSVRESKTKELASCFVILYTDTKPNFKIYDLVEFNDRKWILSVKNTVRKKEYYQINITLTELTLILEKFILPPCSFTNINDTLLDQVNKLFYKVKPLRQTNTPQFKITEELRLFLIQKPSEDFVFSERLTVREALDEMLSAYGVRCYIEDCNSDFTDITIGYIDLNEKSDDIKELEKVVTEDEVESAEYYADTFDISVQNTQSKRKNKVIQEWQTMKPINLADASSGSLRLVVDSPIEELVKVLAKWQGTIHEQIGSEVIPLATNVVITYDIVNLFVEQAIYTTMPLDVQENHIAWERGSKEIGVLDTFKMYNFFTTQKLYQYLVDNQVDIAKKYLEANNIEYTSEHLTVSRPLVDQIKDLMLFQVSYNSYLDFHFKQSKDNANVKKNITSILNQTDRSVDIDRYTNTVRSLANTVGNNELTVDVVANSKDNLLKLGDRIDNGYSVVRREYQVFNEHVKCKYTFMQNYQANSSARLSRERRLYNIPNENLVERSIIIKDNLLLSTEPIDEFNDSLLSFYALEEIVNSFDPTKPHKYIERLLFQTRDGDNNTYPATGRFSVGFAGRVINKSIIFQAKTFDNYSVGLSTGKRIVGGREVHLNPFVDSLGEAERIFFNFVHTKIDELEFNDQLAIGNSLPTVPDTLLSNYIEKSFALSYNYILKKDRLETLNIIYQLESVSNDVIIGNEFMKFINLLEHKETAELRIWVSQTEMYSASDLNRCKGTRTTSKPLVETGPENYRVYADYSALNHMSSWAIGTIDGTLLLAVNNNKQNLDNIYFGLKSH